MVNYCVCAGCTNSSLTGLNIHHFPGFQAWVCLVQVKRVDFISASVIIHSLTVICGAHLKKKYYQPCDLMAYKMGFQCLDRLKLINDAVPSVHSTESSSPPLELVDAECDVLPKTLHQIKTFHQYSSR